MSRLFLYLHSSIDLHHMSNSFTRPKLTSLDAVNLTIRLYMLLILCLVQEARVSRAVELMVAHVESLRKRHDRNVAELEDIKNTMQQQQQKNVYRSSIHPTITPGL